MVATIHDREYPEGALVDVGIPNVNSDGTFLVMAGALQTELFLADRTGSILKRIGRDGEGPGEFRRIFHVHELPSAYLVFDSRLQRVTRLSKDNLEVLGTAQFPRVEGATPLLVFEDGSYLRSGISRTREGAGRFFHLFDASGRGIRSFGGREEVPGSRFQTYPRVLALSCDGTFWAADYLQYRLERWDREGNLLEIIERVADWHPDYSLDENGRLPRGDRTRIQGLWEDQDGLLWVLGREVKGGPVIGSNLEDLTSVIEVIDPKGGTLVASYRVEGVMAFPTRSGFYQTVRREDPKDLMINIEVWGARFVSGPKHPEKRMNHG
jgi:hypothetical protein